MRRNANVNIHRRITDAARARDADAVRALMAEHMQQASGFVKQLNGKLQGRLILDSDMPRRSGARRALSRGKAKE